MNKKIVHYVLDDGIIGPVGFDAQVISVDHPGFAPYSKITTSTVEVIREGGIFETHNTIYKPLQQLNG